MRLIATETQLARAPDLTSDIWSVATKAHPQTYATVCCTVPDQTMQWLFVSCRATPDRTCDSVCCECPDETDGDFLFAVQIRIEMVTWFAAHLQIDQVTWFCCIAPDRNFAAELPVIKPMTWFVAHLHIYGRITWSYEY